MKLIIKFTDQSESFCNGVEFGRLLEKMERGDLIIYNNGFPVHEENINVIKQACKEYGYIPIMNEVKVDNEEDMFEGWQYFTALKKEFIN